MEFHISRKARDAYKFDASLFSLRGTAVFHNVSASREFARKLQQKDSAVRYQDIYAMGLIDEILHFILGLYSKEIGTSFSESSYAASCEALGEQKTRSCVRKFVGFFPPLSVYRNQMDADSFLDASYDGTRGWACEFEEMLMLWIENQNPAYEIAKELIDDSGLQDSAGYTDFVNFTYSHSQALPTFGPDNQNIIEMLRSPALAFPHSLEQQLEYIREHWGYLLGDYLNRLLRGIDYLKEVNAFFLKSGIGGLGKETYVLEYGGGGEEYERFSPDRDWMPRVVLLAKTTLVWLDQLSKKYEAPISRLDQIPDEELDGIAGRGFNALWLIGLWARSDASRKIKNACGNPEAAASAYSLYDYEIADEIGAWAALENLRWRAWNRGIRLASDMVPNHTGIESRWVEQHPDWYVQVNYPPFPGYTFDGQNLSSNGNPGLFLEDHYYNQTDAAVVFKRVDYNTGDTRYIYHGNDGTHMPWNDTAQLDFTKKEVREAVIQTIIHVAKNFPIIRFDAAMTLAKRHIQRLWFPEPGHGGDIPSRSEHGMTAADFNAALPQEFWREVVDRCAVEAPDTLLLAEAFWMMEGYFVRTLGMHRVYNSAFMNMLKNEENAKYRQTIKNTISFDKDILKRFVNFMNNPDEDTAVAQFGTGDKYFGVCTVMVTMPGLPMFGHGQVEGFREKYGMEFRRAYLDEKPDGGLVERHYREIFPLVKKRYLFAEVDQFHLFELFTENGILNENVFAYSNCYGPEKALVLYNNSYESTWGTIQNSAPYVQKGKERVTVQKSLGAALGLRNDANSYCLMREQRSEKWFLRRSSELFENGLGVILRGYESQVYMDIHEVFDNAYQHYRQLHDHLNGAGVADVAFAIRDLVLGPIYRSFETTLGPDLWAQVPIFFAPDKAAREKFGMDFIAGFERFVAECAQFSPRPEVFATAAAHFSAFLDKLNHVFASVKKGQKQAAWMDYFTKGFERQERCVLVFATLLLHCVSEENEEWGLHHKIEILGDSRYQIPALLNVLRELSSWNREAVTDLSEGLGYMEVQEFLLVNYYDGVRWYNKERFEDLCWWAFAWEILDRQEIEPVRAEALYNRATFWLEAHSQADFKLETLKSLVSKTKARAGAKGLKGARK